MGKARILFVEDDPAAQKLYRAYLVNDGYEVIVASSGLEGVEATEKQDFDLVVMDLNMPGLDGWMAMSLIRARRPHLQTVILTAGSGNDLEAQAKNAGAAAFLTKPCTPEALSRAVAVALSKARR
jgi:CheY-like chemotaxis protein